MLYLLEVTLILVTTCLLLCTSKFIIGVRFKSEFTTGLIITLLNYEYEEGIKFVNRYSTIDNSLVFLLETVESLYLELVIVLKDYYSRFFMQE